MKSEKSQYGKGAQLLAGSILKDVSAFLSGIETEVQKDVSKGLSKAASRLEERGRDLKSGDESGSNDSN